MTDSVSVTDWSACYNDADDILVLSCTVKTNDGSAAISGVGLILNTAQGQTMASTYTEISGDNESVMPALNLPPAGFSVGDTVSAVVSGEAGGEHFFFQEKLTIGKC